MDKTNDQVLHKIETFHRLCPSGFVVVINMTKIVPDFMETHYPSTWLQTYNSENMVKDDPCIRHVLGRGGYINWDDLIAKEPENRVLCAARDFGLVHGHTLSHRDGGCVSMISGAGRPWSEEDKSTAESALDALSATVRAPDFAKAS